MYSVSSSEIDLSIDVSSHILRRLGRFAGLAIGILMTVSPAPAQLSPSATLTSPNVEKGSGFGSALATPDAGDRTVVVGAWREDVDTHSDAGRAYLFDGETGKVLQTFESPNAEEQGYFGSAVAGVKDVNGDKTPDVLVGALTETVDNQEDAGRVYLFSGANGTLLRTLTSPHATADGHYGSAVAGLGDVTGDGAGDLIVGAPQESVDGQSKAGRVYLYSGADGSLLHTLVAPTVESLGTFGKAVTGLGDVSGDDTADLLVGAPGQTAADTREAGRAYVLSGADGSLLYPLQSANPQIGGAFGERVTRIGDVNGNGTPDVAVGAKREKVKSLRRSGRVYLFDGADGRPLRTLSSPKAVRRGHFGSALARGGDPNGDGTADLLVGAGRETVDTHRVAGRAYLLSGADGRTLRTLVSPNAQTTGSFAEAAGGMGTANGGKTRVAIGASYERVDGKKGAGRVYVYTFTSSNTDN